MPASKRCSKCQHVKALTEYQRDASQTTGYKSACKACSNKARDARRGAPYENPLKEAARRAREERKAIEATGNGPLLTRLKLEGKWPSVDAFDAEDAEASEPEPRIEVVGEIITQVEEHRLKKKVRELEAANKQLIEQLSEGGEYHEFVNEVLAHQDEAEPAINPRERKSGLAEATPLVLASDWHVEQEVTPEQVAGRNRYNLDISANRMERFFEAARWGWTHQREIFKIRDMIGWWGGDFLQNFLHEDDIENNLLAPLDTILFLQANITKGIDYWLQDPEIEQFLFPCNDGNHGRTTKKMRSSTRRAHSLEVLLYAQLANHYKNEPRVKFILPTSQFTFLDDVYGRTIRFLHGDVFRYGGGIGGITVPMFRAQSRWETVKHADLTCLGHWHSRICLPDLMVNGSLIGYDAFAMGGGFPFQAPVQSLRMLEPKRWCSTDIPLWVSDRSDDNARR